MFRFSSSVAQVAVCLALILVGKVRCPNPIAPIVCHLQSGVCIPSWNPDVSSSSNANPDKLTESESRLEEAFENLATGQKKYSSSADEDNVADSCEPYAMVFREIVDQLEPDVAVEIILDEVTGIKYIQDSSTYDLLGYFYYPNERCCMITNKTSGNPAVIHHYEFNVAGSQISLRNEDDGDVKHYRLGIPFDELKKDMARADVYKDLADQINQKDLEIVHVHKILNGTMLVLHLAKNMNPFRRGANSVDMEKSEWTLIYEISLPTEDIDSAECFEKKTSPSRPVLYETSLYLKWNDEKAEYELVELDNAPDLKCLKIKPVESVTKIPFRS